MNESIAAVEALFKEFLTENGLDWGEDELFDLESDIVNVVLKYEFPDSEVGYETATFDEEEALIEVEWDIGRITQNIAHKWTEKTMKKKAKKVVEVAIASIKKNFKITDEGW